MNARVKVPDDLLTRRQVASHFKVCARTIKRGTVYNLLRDGKIRGVLMRVRGQKSGVRLFDMALVRDFIRSQMEGENRAAGEGGE